MIYTSVAIELSARLANFAQFMFNIKSLYDYIGLFAGLALLGAFPGVLYLSETLKAGKRAAYVLLVYSLLLVVALVANVVTDAISINHDFKNGIGGFYFYEYC